MIYNMVKRFNKQFGVVLNKCLDGENPAEKHCMDNSIKILGKIPFEEELGLLNSNWEIAVYKNDKYKELFSTVELKVGSGTTGMLVTEVKRQLKEADFYSDLVIISGNGMSSYCFN